MGPPTSRMQTDKTLAARVPREDPANIRRKVAFLNAHQEIRIVDPASNDLVPLLTAEYRYEQSVPEGESQVIYRANDLGMLMDHLEEIFGKPEEKM